MASVEDGVIIEHNGDVFEGEVLDGMPLRGRFLFKSELPHRANHKGDVYEGEFEDGTFHGKGVYHYLSENHHSQGIGTRVASEMGKGTAREPTTTRTATR